MKILVIGKHGYISTSFQNYMKKYPEHEVEAISVRDGPWKSLDFSQFDSVFNTAALAHNNARKGTDEEFMALNAILPVEIAKKAKADGVKEFIHMSSMIVYGSLRPLGDNTKYFKDTVPTPNNIYGRSKLQGEQGLKELEDDNFKVALIRSPLVYGENATDNFGKLVKAAKTFPFFPNIKNERSMIYADNLCELVRLIAENESSGLFCPQQECYICTSKIVKDMADAMHHPLHLTRFFNPILRALSKRVGIVDKVFGTEAYEMNMSNAFDGEYRVVSYEDSIKRIAEAKGKRK